VWQINGAEVVRQAIPGAGDESRYCGSNWPSCFGYQWFDHVDVCWYVRLSFLTVTVTNGTGWTPDHHKKPLLELRKAGHGKFVRQRMKETDVLVVDEISMVENLHFERLNAVMKEARGDGRAFGGVQLIVTGDVSYLNVFCIKD
jgi:hypothetical protein